MVRFDHLDCLGEFCLGIFDNMALIENAVEPALFGNARLVVSHDVV
jgi:hypothetical protein